MQNDTDSICPGQLSFPWFGGEPSANNDSITEAPVVQPEPEAPAHASSEEMGRELLHYLQARTKRSIHLTVTDNTASLMSLRPARAGKTIHARVHHMFLAAPEPVREAMADWILRPRSKKHADTFRLFVQQNADKIRARTRHLTLRPAGRAYDLGLLYNQLNQKHFDAMLDAHITWGKPSYRGRRSIRLGSYNHEKNLISIHPCLDDPAVPLFVVRQIIYHEMIHACLRNRNAGRTRRLLHDRLFQALEQAGKDYEEAEAWLANKDNLDHVMRLRTKREA